MKNYMCWMNFPAFYPKFLNQFQNYLPSRINLTKSQIFYSYTYTVSYKWQYGLQQCFSYPKGNPNFVYHSDDLEHKLCKILWYYTIIHANLILPVCSLHTSLFKTYLHHHSVKYSFHYIFITVKSMPDQTFKVFSLST